MVASEDGERCDVCGWRILQGYKIVEHGGWLHSVCKDVWVELSSQIRSIRRAHTKALCIDMITYKAQYALIDTIGFGKSKGMIGNEMISRMWNLPIFRRGWFRVNPYAVEIMESKQLLER